MCFTCTLTLYCNVSEFFDKNKKINIGKYGDYNSTYIFDTNHEAPQWKEENCLELAIISSNDRDALITLLQSPLRKEFRRKSHPIWFYDNLLCGAVTIIIREKFDAYVRNFYISTIIDDLQSHQYPIDIIKEHCTMNSSSDFIVILIRLVMWYKHRAPFSGNNYTEEQTCLYNNYYKEFTREIKNPSIQKDEYESKDLNKSETPDELSDKRLHT
jgi:hypothetical protein